MVLLNSLYNNLTRSLICLLSWTSTRVFFAIIRIAHSLPIHKVHSEPLHLAGDADRVNGQIFNNGPSVLPSAIHLPHPVLL